MLFRDTGVRGRRSGVEDASGIPNWMGITQLCRDGGPGGSCFEYAEFDVLVKFSSGDAFLGQWDIRA